jgi:hypothetical protein
MFTLYKYFLAGDLRNVALSFLSAANGCALNLSSSDPKFKQLEQFLNNVRISIPSSNKQTKIICGLIERAGKFVFSKNDGQKSTVAIRLLYISVCSFLFLPNSLKLHFQETYNICIRHTNIFGFNISGKKNLHPSVIPAELC